ncbi:MarR family transcriptional regulator [Anopheles sinensis]|uniref:MarR family transcriptional regulator n=1 Tax=Anopheles sinensis TaxID=74873 RepID=A0A084WF46_ANOSI|nr:MarR family transcriptional regulator [Anopheles sinensis]
MKRSLLLWYIYPSVRSAPGFIRGTHLIRTDGRSGSADVAPGRFDEARKPDLWHWEICRGAKSESASVPDRKAGERRLRMVQRIHCTSPPVHGRAASPITRGD